MRHLFVRGSGKGDILTIRKFGSDRFGYFRRGARPHSVLGEDSEEVGVTLEEFADLTG